MRPPRLLHRALVVVALGGLAGLASAATASATFPGQNGKLAYGANGIHVVDPLGRVDTRLTYTRDYETDASFSPDGRRLLFIRRTRGRYSVFTMRSDGSGQRRVTTRAQGGFGSPQFIPGSDRILVTQLRGEPGVLRIATMDLDGGPIQQIAKGWSPSISPDGTEVAFSRSLGPASDQLFVVDIDGSDERQLTPDIDGYSVDEPRWTSDGRRIVIEYRGPYGVVRSGIYSLAADGSDLRREVPRRSNAAFPVPSPDGERIAYGAHAGRCVNELPAGAICGDAIQSYGRADRSVQNIARGGWPDDWASASGGEQDRGRCGGRRATLTGTPLDDEIRGTPGRDVVAAGSGRDVVYGFAGDDLICAGPGEDEVYGERGHDVCSGVERSRSCRGSRAAG